MRTVRCPVCESTFTTTHPHKATCSQECRRAHRAGYERRYRQANGDRRRANAVDRTYGVSADEVARLLEMQGGGCAVCGGANESGRALAVDHDHVTGEVRGLLCDRHNVGLGMFRDDIDHLLAAVAYLQEPTSRTGRWRDGSVLPEA